MAGPSAPSGSNTFVPNPRATGGLLVGYSRNTEDFAWPRYAEMFPVQRNVGIYYQYTSRNAARILSATDAEHLWADGDAAPSGVENLETFQDQTYFTQRRVYPF